MDNNDSCPMLIACKKLQPEFDYLQQIPLITDNFSIGRGRGLNHSVVIPFLTISRSHCIFKNCLGTWTLEDQSSFGVRINSQRVGKGCSKTLFNGDIITFDQTEEFVYKFVNPSDEVFEIPRKRMKTDSCNNNENIINNVKMKFEESQNYEAQRMEEKIQNTKQVLVACSLLQQQMRVDMNRRIKQLETSYAALIEKVNFEGEKDKVEGQKALLIENRDAKVFSLTQHMEKRISDLTEKIEIYNVYEENLIKENNTSMKEKLTNDRVQFEAELSTEHFSKEDMLYKLEAKVKYQKNKQLKDRQEFLDMLQTVARQMRSAKEKELQEEIELKQRLDSVSNSVNRQMSLTEQDKTKPSDPTDLLGNWLIDQLQYLKSLNEKINLSFNQQYTLLCQLDYEKAEIHKKLIEAQRNYVGPYKLRKRNKKVGNVRKSKPAFVPKRIQKLAEKSSAVISTLEQKLKQEENERASAQNERKMILDYFSILTVLSEVRALIECELQCSICTELFVTPFTLNCRHTFCNYCISKWQRRNNTCPICRTPITSEAGCTTLNLIIMKMVHNFDDDMKAKRNEIIENRKELETLLLQQPENDDESFSSSYEDDSNAMDIVNDSSDDSIDSFSIDSSEEPDMSSHEADFEALARFNYINGATGLDSVEDYLEFHLRFDATTVEISCNYVEEPYM